MNRLSEVQESGAPDPRLRYAYDASSNVLTTVEAAGRTTQYTYDAQQRVTQAADADAGAGTTTTHQYDYNPSGLVQTVADPSGVVYRYDYDGTTLREATVLPLYFVTFEADETVETPEPSAAALFCGGVLSLVGRTRRRRQ